MANDRLERFKTNLSHKQEDEEMVDLEAGEEGEEDEEDPAMGEFYKEVGAVKEMLSEFRQNLQNLESKHKQMMGAANGKKKQANAAELEALLTSTKNLSAKIKNKLEGIGERYKPSGSNSVNDRIKKNTHGTLLMKFVEMMKDFQEKQKNFKGSLMERYKRQIRIVDPEISEEAIEDAIRDGKADQIFASKILEDSARSEAIGRRDEILEQNKDIQELEKSVMEIHQLFLDMSTMVSAQGALIDRIEENVAEAADYVAKGKEHVKQAAKYACSARKKKCCIIIICIIIIAIIGGVIAAVVASKMWCSKKKGNRIRRGLFIFKLCFKMF